MSGKYEKHENSRLKVLESTSFKLLECLIFFFFLLWLKIESGVVSFWLKICQWLHFQLLYFPLFVSVWTSTLHLYKTLEGSSPIPVNSLIWYNLDLESLKGLWIRFMMNLHFPCNWVMSLQASRKNMNRDRAAKIHKTRRCPSFFSLIRGSFQRSNYIFHNLKTLGFI